jgi:hypothetical protein
MALAALVGLVGAILLPGTALGAGAFVVTALATLFALLMPRLRLVLRILAVAFGLAALVYTLVEQATQQFLAADWLSHFERASELVWMTVALLLADLLVGLIRRMVR